jgi:NAD(P)H-hydrate epimerase
MATVSVSEMRAAEAAALEQGWTEERLLDLAGARLGRALGRWLPTPGTAIGYLGKGHNAGDALVALRVLRDEFGWKIAARNAYAPDDCSALTRAKWRDLGLASTMDQPPAWRDLDGPLVLLDGLLGTGTSGALRDPLLALAAEMEWLRQNAGARVAAVDLPSGIDADTGVSSPGSVTADITFMIGNAKRGLLAGHAANATGALALVPIDALTAPGCGEVELIAPQSQDFAKSPRPYDFHKGMAGRVVVLAGSETYPGAAVLAATGALRGGAGLITLLVPKHAAAVIATKCPPEIIVHGYASPAEWHDLHFDSRVVGCGLGTLDAATAACLLDWLAESNAPTVIDADALNLIARADKSGIFSPQHILTPHPGEFQRLAPDLAGLPRELAARTFADRTPATLLLKGCRTLVTRRKHPLWCNATGTPGMASGGQGDLLAGVIGARLATGQDPLEAAMLAAWVCGRSAEIALNQPGISEESLTPSDVASHLGAAFRDWQCSQR